jgi:ubiquinone biosynthesis protein
MRLRFGLRAVGVTQLVALLGAAFAAVAIRLTPPRSSREARLARRLAATLGRLRGPFAKVGQLASLRVDLVAPELRESLSALRDRVAPIPASWARDLIESELGAPLPALFAAFDPTPLGAASIAQAHAARLPDGSAVVVKVQYPWLATSGPADLALLRHGLGLWLGGPAPGAWWLEFERGLAEELDFRREAAVAREVAENLAKETQVVVPRIVSSHSTGRVLTMERWPVLPLSDPATLDRRGIPRSDVVETIVRAYARQIFQDGLFHADPHPGNLFVIDEPEAALRPRVLFVDFGLSQRLPPALAHELRLGILALLSGDLDAFVAGMARIGAVAPGAEAGVRQAVSTMFGRIRNEGGSALGLGADRILSLKDEAKQLLYETPGLSLPSDLLLYAKTLSYLFSLARELAPSVEPMQLCLPPLLRFLATREPSTASADGGPAGG